MLTNVRGRGDDLGLADVVVLNVNDLQQITNIFVVVDDFANAADKMNDSLGHPVAWSGFASEDRYSWCKFLALLRAHRLDGKIAVEDTKDVQLLSLVLMYTLDLDVEQRFRVDADAGGIFDVLCQADLVGVLDLLPFLLEIRVIKEMFELVQLSEIRKEVITSKLRGNQFAKLGVRLVEPSSRSNTVCYISEFVRTVDSDKVFEYRGLDKVRM